MKKRTWLLAIAVAVGGVVGSTHAQTAPAKPVAVVNGEPITLAQVDAVINREGPKAVPTPEAKLREMRHGILAAMIDDILFQQYIRKSCPPANPQDIESEYLKLIEALKQGKSPTSVEEFCKQNSTTPAELKVDIGDIIRWRGLVNGQVTEAAVQKYYNDFKDMFDGVFVRASHIVIRVPGNGTDAERQAAINKLKSLRQEIVAGKLDFAEAAKKHSQCPTAEIGGDLNFFPRKFKVDEVFAKTAFAMKIGDVSDVVQTEFGYHLIKVTGRNPGTPSEFAKIKDDVKEIMALEIRNGIILQQRKVSKVEMNLP
jgi:hypothetical protein